MKKIRYTALALAVLTFVGLLAGCKAKPVAGGQLVIGVSDVLTGEFGCGQWDTTQADSIVRGLTQGGSPVLVSADGQYSVDSRYVSRLDETYQPDGSKTYTVHLREDLRWSDGSEVTAANYIASVLIFSSAAAKSTGATGLPGAYYVGAEEYIETGYFSGVHLVDRFTFSVTVKAEFVPYYWEYSYLDIVPVDLKLWLPEGTGISYSSAGCSFSPEMSLTPEAVTNLRFASSERRSLGPYIFKGRVDGMTLLEKNQNFVPAEENSGPYIDRLMFIETDGSLAALENGKVDMVVGLENAYSEASDLCTGESFGFADYGADEIVELAFQCDFGPARFVGVRKALVNLCDRQTFAQKLSGDGATVPNLMFSEALSEKLNEDFKPADYVFSKDNAWAMLLDGGWTLNAAGEVYTSGIRYKLVTAEEAEDCIDTVTLADGRILMPLRLRLACEAGTGYSLFLADLAMNAANLGMEIVATELSAEELEDRLTRNASDGIVYAVPLYNGYVVKTPVDTRGDLSQRWTDDWREVSEGKNICYFTDSALCDIANMQAYGSENSEEFFELLTQHTARWCETVPELPISRGRVCDVYSAKLKGYTPGTGGDFAAAILNAWIEE